MVTSRPLQPRPGKVTGGVSRAVASVILLAFFAAGAFVCENGIRHWRRELSTRRWPAVSCTISQSRVVPRGKLGAGPFEWQVAYRYEWGGQLRTSTCYTLAHGPSDDYASEERLRLRYPPGQRNICWVDPSDSSRAVLDHDAAYSWTAIPLGLAIGLIPAFTMWSTWCRRRRRSGATEGALPATIVPSQKVGGIRATGVVALAFLVGGAALLWFAGVRPSLRARAAAIHWTRAPCTVVSSSIAEHPGAGEDNAPTYSANVLYEYAIHGEVYRSNRFDFAVDFGGAHDRQWAIVRQFPTGLRTVCYVNPADPLDAVLRPTAGPHVWLCVILSVIFLAIGVAMHRGGRSA